jgi:dipeptidyl-peptidase-3
LALCAALSTASGCTESGAETASAETPAAPVAAEEGQADAGDDAGGEGVVQTKPPSGDAENASAWVVDRFADAQVLRYQVPGFDDLPLSQKKLLYFLSQAALAGRDINYDQKFRHNLVIRRTLEAVWNTPAVDRSGPAWKAFSDYTKQVWFARGIHHDYAKKKLVPKFSKEDFAALVKQADATKLPLQKGEDVDALIAKLTPILFDVEVAPKRVDRSPGVDQVKASSINYYAEDLTQAEVEKFYATKTKGAGDDAVSFGLNSKVVKQDGALTEKVWKADGMYGPAIVEIVKWLKLAVGVAENAEQKRALELLVKYYETGDLKTFDDYNIAWVADVNSAVDVVNGFIEVYDDPLGYKGSWESVVSFKDQEATKRIAAIAGEAQWFEDNSSILDEHKKKSVVGISAKVITVVQEGGDASPTTPIGINLPNSNWIRAKHGSKSVNLGNIVHAYDEAASGSGKLEEFVASHEELERAKQHGTLAHTLLVDMHEVIGHASGQIEKGIGTPKETLGSYASALEEGRADLVGLYFLMDPKLVEMGLMPSLDVGKAEYDSYIRNGMMVQLSRLELGDDVEESHMRNRQMVAAWAFEKGEGKVIEKQSRDGKTYFVVKDYEKLRGIFGELLKELQRIKSQGDQAAGKALIEGYGVKVDRVLHEEVLSRMEKLDLPAYSGFVHPRVVAVKNDKGEIVDVELEQPADFAAQMLEYSAKHSFLPDYN